MKKQFGQHFLFDTNILKKIVRESGLTPDDTVVEVGPGLGTLTQVLSETARKVIALELDKKLMGRLQDNLSGSRNVTIINADALKYPYETIRGRFRVIANIPYYITTPLIFKVLEQREKLLSMTLLMQKEVAKRIVASPGTKDYGILTLSLQMLTTPDIRFTVSRKAFSPPPDVDSAVVHFQIPAAQEIGAATADLVMTVARTAFHQRRKTIQNSLKNLGISKDMLASIGIDPKTRPERLGLEDFIAIAKQLAQPAEKVKKNPIY